MDGKSRVFCVMVLASSFVKTSSLRVENTTFPASGNHLNFLDDDLSFLSELPLEKLLKVKKSLSDLKYKLGSNDNGITDDALESRMNDDESFGIDLHDMKRSALTSANNEVKINR